MNKYKLYYCHVWNGLYVRINFNKENGEHITNILLPTELWESLKPGLESVISLKEYNK